MSAVLLGMSAVVLLVACLNLANMLLARGTARRKEIAIRLSLGAGRVAIVRQLLTEGFLVSLGGGAVGLAVGYWAMVLLVQVNRPPDADAGRSRRDPRLARHAWPLGLRRRSPPSPSRSDRPSRHAAGRRGGTQGTGGRGPRPAGAAVRRTQPAAGRADGAVAGVARGGSALRARRAEGRRGHARLRARSGAAGGDGSEPGRATPPRRAPRPIDASWRTCARSLASRRSAWRRWYRSGR